MKKTTLALTALVVLGTTSLFAETKNDETIKYADNLLCKITATGSKTNKGDFDMVDLNDMDTFFRTFDISDNGKKLTSGKLTLKYDSARKNQTMRYTTSDKGIIEFAPVEMKEGYNSVVYDIHWYLAGDKEKAYGTCITRIKK